MKTGKITCYDTIKHLNRPPVYYISFCKYKYIASYSKMWVKPRIWNHKQFFGVWFGPFILFNSKEK